MKNLSLKQLRYFNSLVKHKHFAKAAHECSISQPALSMQIRDLENTLGLRLFEKGIRPIRLTPFGRIMHERTTEILAHLSDVHYIARAFHNNPMGTFNIGIIPTIAPYIFPHLIQILRQIFPQLVLKLRESITSQLIDKVLHGQLDAAIVALPIADSQFIEYTLFSEPFYLVRPISEATHPQPTIGTLQNKQLLLLEEGHCFRTQALAFCNMAAHPTPNIMEASSLSTLVQMVSAGLGVTFLPHMAIDIEKRATNAKVDIQQFGNPSPTRTIGMIWRKKTPMQAHFYKIADVIQKHHPKNI